MNNRGKLKRTFIGYSPESVLEAVLTKQRVYQNDLAQLRSKLAEERSWNKKLLSQAPPSDENLTTSSMKPHPLVDMLFEHLILSAKSIADLKAELTEREEVVKLELELKKKQKEAAENRILTAVQYLKSLPDVEAMQERSP